MEKLIYLLEKPASQTIDAFSQTLRGDVIAGLRQAGASNITLNIADLNEQIAEQAPGRLIGPWQAVSAAVAFWHDYADGADEAEACLRDISHKLDGYLVTEAVPQGFQPEWEGGARRPGVTQFGANAKPADVADEDFYRNWQQHSVSSFELHPLRWSYVRNAVLRPLTAGAPAYRCIVSEHFRDLEDFCDDVRYFGSEQAVATMIAEVAGFCDFGNMFSLAMSEYFFA